MVKITGVTPGSPAARAGIRTGELLSINGNDINDVLDYRYYSAETLLDIAAESSGSAYTFRIEKDEYEDPGLEFESFLMDTEKRCKNNCIFCFIDQNPPGLRETLYFKDDDARLSFLTGNYITLTNLSEYDIDRIIKMHLSVNVSLHTMNPALRVKMMNNRFAGEGINYLRRMVEAGVKVNIQMVLCPGINDGAELEYTLSELFNLFAVSQSIESIAAVPVGLTKYRDGLFPLEPFDKTGAKAVIETIDTFGERFKERFGRRMVYASDEFFLLAGLPVPDTGYYEDYPQYENGVGFLRSFTDEFYAAMDETAVETAAGTPTVGAPTIIITGESAYSTLVLLIEDAKSRFPGIDCTVIKVKNNFFGGHVTVTGLLTGSDIIAALQNLNLCGTVLINEDCFKKDTELFLDDTTLSDVSNALGCKCEKIPRDGFAVFERIRS
jgi:putative radical SAM enzyme (TIGR03279 family)